jgi:hypothetical protein
MGHLETKHGNLKHKTLEYFQRKLPNLLVSKGQIVSVSGVQMKAVKTCYIFKESLQGESIVQLENSCCNLRYGQVIFVT